MAGRKNKYETHVAPRFIEIRHWVRNGMIDRDVARKLGVSYASFRTYVQKEKELAELMRESKEVADAKVVNALFEAATGKTIEDVKTTYRYLWDDKGNPVLDAEGNPVRIKEEETVTQKTLEGNVRAQQFWLKNRMPGDWKDKVEASIDGELELGISEELFKGMRDLFDD